MTVEYFMIFLHESMGPAGPGSNSQPKDQKSDSLLIGLQGPAIIFVHVLSL